MEFERRTYIYTMYIYKYLEEKLVPTYSKTKVRATLYEIWQLKFDVNIFVCILFSQRY